MGDRSRIEGLTAVDEQARHTIVSALDGITADTATASTGSFSFTPDEMRDIINQFLDLAGSYERSLDNARAIASVEAPGLEYVSESHAIAVRAMGEDYLRSIEDSRQYCLAQAQKFQDTLDDYLGLENHNVASLNQSGAPIAQSGPVDGI